MSGINCCYKCQDRTIGCHAKCERYLNAKAQYEIDKAKIKADLEKLPYMSKYEFDMLKCMHDGRGKH